MPKHEKMELEDAVEFVLKEASKRFDDVVVRATRTQARQIKFTNNEVSTGKTWMDQSVGVFVAKDRRLATIDIKELERKEILNTLNKLAKLVKQVQPNKEYGGIAEGPFRYKEIMNTFDPAIPKLGEELVDFVEKGVNAALEHGAVRSSGKIQSSYTKEVLLTSNDVHAHQKGTSITFSIRSFVEKDASAHRLSCARTMQHFRPEEAGARAGEMARQASNPKPGSAGKFDVLFDPLPFAALLDHVGSAVSIYSVEAGLSFLENRLNRRVAAEGVTIYDDATLPGGMASTKYDAEGTPTRRNIVIRFGMLRTYLHNTSTAKRYKTNSTGNAGLIAPHPWNIVLEKGNFELNEMIREVKHGLFVTNVWYTRFQNYKTGEFSTLPRDAVFLIKNGELAGAVKEVRISDSMPHILINIEAIGKRREQIVGWEVETPVKCGHVLVRGVNVTKSAGKFPVEKPL